MSENEKYRIQQIRDYAEEYVDNLENIRYSGYMRSVIKNVIEDAVKRADSHPKNKIEK